jgi:hypothetical protein
MVGKVYSFLGTTTRESWQETHVVYAGSRVALGLIIKHNSSGFIVPWADVASMRMCLLDMRLAGEMA